MTDIPEDLSRASVMPVASPSVRTEWDMTLGALAAGSAATLDLAEAMRGDMPIADNLRHRETAESLADSLRSVLALLIQSPPACENRDQIGRHEDDQRLLVAVQEYLEGWEVFAHKGELAWATFFHARSATSSQSAMVAARLAVCSALVPAQVSASCTDCRPTALTRQKPTLRGTPA